jgi:predicted DNA-binding transcriptional regulator AlpA
MRTQGTDTSEPLIDEHEAAALIGVTASTMNSWRVKRVGPRFVRVGRLVRYRPSDVRSYIDEKLVHTSDQPGKRGGA